MIIILVEIDLYDGNTSTIKTLRISNLTFMTIRDDNWVQFYPNLILPIELGTRISADEFSQAQRGAPNGGNIGFVIEEDLWPWLNYHWLSRKFRIYQGQENWKFEDFELIYSGRVADFTFDAVSNLASVKTTDASNDLDEVLVEDLYPDEEGILEAIREKPKPYLRGTVYSAQPVLEDEVIGFYRLSHGANLDKIMEIRVGGVPWEEYTGVDDPKEGQWKGNLPGGYFTLGSPTLGAEVRCDVRTIAYDTYNSGKLIQEIIESSGGEIDTTSFNDFKTLLPGLIGYYATEPVNKLDVLDEIVFGCGAWWEFGSDGKARVGVLKSPETVSDFNFSTLDIKSFELSKIVLPIWRIKVEYKRNWQVLTDALSGVTDSEAEAMAEEGIIAQKFEDEDIKILEPQAVDLPIVRSLFVEENDAIEVRDRLAKAWGVESRIYNMTCFNNSTPDLYSTVGVDFQMIDGMFRLHSVERSIGSELLSLQIWGSEGYTGVLDTPFTIEDYYILSDTDDFIVINGTRAIWTTNAFIPKRRDLFLTTSSPKIN